MSVYARTVGRDEPRRHCLQVCEAVKSNPKGLPKKQHKMLDLKGTAGRGGGRVGVGGGEAYSGVLRERNEHTV